MTTNHPVDREEIMALADAELSPARASIVRAHLDTCAECRATLDDLRGVSSQLGAWTIEPAPESLRVIAPAIVPPRRSWWTSTSAVPRWALAAAATVIVIGGVFATHREGAGEGVRENEARLQSGDALTASNNGSLLDRVENSLKKSAPSPLALRQTEAKDAKQSARVDAFGAAAQSAAPANKPEAPPAFQTDAPMIVRTAQISLSTDRFDDVRARLEQVARVQGGHVGDLSVSGDPSSGRALSATLRVPVTNMDAALSAVRGLGKMLSESQNAEDITDAHRDLTVRIANAKVEEARLGDILANRTGKLADVLQVEQAQSRVRGEIEQMEAEEASERGRAAMSTIGIQVSEVPHADLAIGPLPLSTRIRNTFVDAVRGTLELMASLLLVFIGALPMLVLVALVSAWPIRWMWKRVRLAFAR